MPEFEPTPLDAPTSATAPPGNIAIGPSTLAGLGGALGAFVLAIIGFFHGHRDTETVGAMATGAVILYGVIHHRGKQAVAQIENGGLAAVPEVIGELVSDFNHDATLSGADLATAAEDDDTEDDEEPGDPDALPHIPATDPSQVPIAHDQDDSVHADEVERIVSGAQA